ncbi:MAG: hypothetical protein ABIO95_04660 [Bdellovibrionota bacterium]
MAGVGLVSASARADYTRDSYRDIRLLGRGNTGIADVTGGPAAFYNPAGLADATSVSFVPFDFSLGANKNLVTSFSTISSLTSSNQTLSQKFSPLLGKPMALQGTFFPHIAVPGFMAGFYDYSDVNIEYRDPVFPRLDLQARNDWGLVFGAGKSVLPNLQLGASVRYMKRRSLEDVLNMATVFNLTGAYLSQISRDGEAWGINVGSRFSQKLGPSSWVAAGLVVEDVGRTSFHNSDRSPLPERQAEKVNFGLAYGAQAPVGAFKVLFDVKELNNTSKSTTKKIFTGAEISTSVMTMRAGLFQGYWTAGLSTSLIPLIDLDITTYGEELASAAGLRESRYWLIGFRTGLDVKKSEKKKQRYSLDGL